MRRDHVQSTVISTVGYDTTTAMLEIEFTSGDLYRYYAVPPSAHRGLLAAESAGRFFAERIRSVYPTEQVR